MFVLSSFFHALVVLVQLMKMKIIWGDLVVLGEPSGTIDGPETENKGT